MVALIVLCASPAIFADDQSAAKAKEQELIKALQSGPPEEKAIACKQLAIYGSADAVPELAKLLPDEHLSSWSRIALEAIPGPAAGNALLKATESVHGLLLVGTINSIGVRRDVKALERLAELLKDQDAQVASASAVALGRVGNDAAAKILRASLQSTPEAVRSAVAEGCILCAEQRMAEGKSEVAAAIYDEVRKADVPKQRKYEATRGAILARKADGIPLLVEQLRSPDNRAFQIGLVTARQLPGPQVADALATELTQSSPERAALLVSALMDRQDDVLPHAVLAAAQNGEKQVRLAAIGVIGRRGDATSVPILIAIATDNDADLAQAAQAALASLPGKPIDSEIVSRLHKAQAKELAALIQTVGQRRINATSELVKALDQNDPAFRSAALTALGETAGPKDLSILIAAVISPKSARRRGSRTRPPCSQHPHAGPRCLRRGTRRGDAAPTIPTRVKLLEILAPSVGKSHSQQSPTR